MGRERIWIGPYRRGQGDVSLMKKIDLAAVAVEDG